MSTIEVKVPDIGDFKDVPVIEVFVKPGDTVKAEDSLVTLESDKATMDVPSPAAGKVKELKVKVGDKVSEGSVIVLLDAARRAGPRHRPPSPRFLPRRSSRLHRRHRRRLRPHRRRSPRQRTTPRSAPRTRRLRCARSRASSASISPRSAAPARRLASCRRTCRAS